jgi:hypothetical protein
MLSGMTQIAGNWEFAIQIEQVLWTTCTAHRDYQAGKLSREAITLPNIRYQNPNFKEF